MYSEYNITEEVNNSILTIFRLDLHRRVQRCGIGDAVVQLNCTPDRAEVTVLINLCIILFKISCNVSALCSKFHALFSK